MACVFENIRSFVGTAIVFHRFHAYDTPECTKNLQSYIKMNENVWMQVIKADVEWLTFDQRLSCKRTLA